MTVKVRRTAETPPTLQGPSHPMRWPQCKPLGAFQTLLMGDAAHAVVPFYGQGMNAVCCGVGVRGGGGNARRACLKRQRAAGV
jgi:hypothetical protein